MFTGIITQVGVARSVAVRGEARILTVSCDFKDIGVGESIAVEGCCLTVTAVDDHACEFFISAETLGVSALGRLAVGSRVNLERALLIGDRLGGHFVTGHIDAVGRITAILPEAESRRVRVSYPHRFSPFVMDRGSVTIAGVSLTVVDFGEAPSESPLATLEVNLIPATLAATTLGSAKVGAEVNIEFDLLAKYFARSQEANDSQIVSRNRLELETRASVHDARHA